MEMRNLGKTQREIKKTRVFEAIAFIYQAHRNLLPGLGHRSSGDGGGSP